MRVLGVDPGITTGVAYYDSVTQTVLRKFDTQNPVEVLALIDELHAEGDLDHVVVENVLGHGMRDSNIIRTIKILGAVEFHCRARGIPVTLHPPQIRKHKIYEAAKLSPRSSAFHFRDALAHCLAFVSVREKRDQKHGKLRPRVV